MFIQIIQDRLLQRTTIDFEEEIRLLFNMKRKMNNASNLEDAIERVVCVLRDSLWKQSIIQCTLSVYSESYVVPKPEHQQITLSESGF
jgi:hypothetical protein